ncbi:MAG TPA: dihydrolipoamide acetyltransferase family protein [Polyangiaceae bacterium LLY-WYZ-15_(1-7)]|nr:dihydrolipoamide acetyltransferase [Myxococcales bacterium]MAT28931.1 dihydrolipoamide acetyltransferase [Sandaracinus sp.]HJL00936.1 dihydrolipoamide acetyltransferase family protein [Polyangiaceae bacterium LLY-WYZ-15_(1-7)]MBJ73061.1 dihydrolipoamide acetyltransferase [Sandaracinus sp.]HJL12290.1 dihydrolipoamide acetyltransferase family protein [Polyangiaceae bacterium LLY-WYZ-15_(1-7)]
MASFEFKLPDIGEGVSEGEIVDWHVGVGDSVEEDDPMVEVMTDKATVTIGAPKAGTIQDLRFDVGAVAQVGQVIVVIDTAGGAVAEAAPEAKGDDDEGPAATAVGDIKDGLPGSTYFAGHVKGERAAAGAGSNGSNGANGHPAPKAAAAPKARSGASAGGGGLQQIDFFQAKPLATPATRKLARELGVDLRRVPPTGPAGRTTRDDVQGFAEAPAAQSPSQSPQASQPASGGAPTLPAQPIQAPTPEAQALEERKPFVGIRRKIAQRMQTAKNTAAHFTFVEECHCDALIEMRARLKPKAAEHGVKLTYLPFIVKAVVAALKKHPVLNSALDETTNELVYRRYFDIGIAAATDAGLMVPVVRGADRLSLLDVAKEIDRVGNGAREGTLKADELSGSTFTITSLGKTGGLFATPVLNHPEVGILGVHQMKQKPVVRDGEIVVGNVMLLSLSFDHRIVDGHVGAQFAYDIIGYLEEPDRLFLEA